VVIGGIAVAAHSVVRATEDLDLVPNPDASNLQRLIEALESLDSRPAEANAGQLSIRPTSNDSSLKRVRESKTKPRADARCSRGLSLF
jgi:hypothetical protein